MKKDISEKESAFCRYTLTEKDITAAAIKAKYSKRSARQIASRLMTKDYIKQEIKRLREKAENKTLINREEIVKEWRKIAFANITRTRNENDEALPLHAMPEEVSAAVEELAEIETQIGTSRRVKMHNKASALKELSKLGGLYPEEGTGESKQIVYVFGNEKD